MNLRIEATAPEGNRLSAAYIGGERGAVELYRAGSSDSIDSYRAVLKAVRTTHPDELWNSIPEEFSVADDALAARIARLAERRGAFVITGQQAGLFTGPLLTIYKALTAVRTAAFLEDRLSVPVVPLFWVTSEDHDWDEVDHAHVVDLENRLRRIGVETDGQEQGPGDPVHRIRLPGSVETALGELVEATPDTEFKQEVLAPLQAAYRPGRGFAQAFEDALRDLTSGLGLVIVQASNPWVKARSRAVLHREWAARQRSAELLAERARQIEAAGFPLQVGLAPDATNLFVEGPKGRDRLLMDGSGGTLRSAGSSLQGPEVERMIEQETDRISAGVLLGPVLQAGTLPVIAHVAGPGEIAYLAQNQPLFELHELPAPVVVPRASFRLIEARVDKVLEKYGLTADAVGREGPDWIEERIRAETPPELAEALDALRKSAGAALERLEHVAVEVDPGSRSAVGSGRKALFDSITELEKKLHGRLRERHQVMRQQLEKAVVHLHPEGRPQERMLNAYPYLIRYGRRLLTELLERVEPALE